MSIFIPHIGIRFTLYGAEYEITYATDKEVRYAATAGGKTHAMQIDAFEKLLNCEKITITNKNSKLEFTQDTIESIQRKHEYISAAIKNLDTFNSKKLLTEIIREVSKKINDQAPPAFSTVTLWIRSYIRNGRTSLPPKPRPGNNTKRYPPEVELLIEEAIENEYLRGERRSGVDVLAYVVGQLHERNLITTDESNIMIPTIRTIQRRIKKLDPYIVAKAKRGKRFADKMARSAGSRITSHAPLSDVEIDTHILDILLIDPDTGDILGRPYLTCIIDRHTRVITGTYICMYPPSAATALAALIDMISRPSKGLPGGIPSKITPDNGVEFKNTSFLHLCGRLSITITPAPIREPNAKALIESFFRSLTHGVIQKIPGTTFSSPLERGDYSSCRKAVLSISQLTDITNEWINEVYHVTVHSRSGRAPILKWNDETKFIPPNFLTETEAQAIARRPVVRSIQHGQIQIDYINYYSHSLATLSAQGIRQVTALVNDLNLNEIYVINPNDEKNLILAVSNDPEYTEGLTWYMHDECRKIKKEIAKSDLKRLGPQSNLLARWKLLEKIQSESTKAKRWVKKIKNGEQLENLKPKKSNPIQEPQRLTQDPILDKPRATAKDSSEETITHKVIAPYKTTIIE